MIDSTWRNQIIRERERAQPPYSHGFMREEFGRKKNMWFSTEGVWFGLWDMCITSIHYCQ